LGQLTRFNLWAFGSSIHSGSRLGKRLRRKAREMDKASDIAIIRSASKSKKGCQRWDRITCLGPTFGAVGSLSNFLLTDSVNKVPKWKFFPNSTTVTCHVAVPISSSVSIIIWPKRLGSPWLPLHTPSLDLSTFFGAAPRRGSEMMQWAFSRTVGNLSFSLSFSTRHTYSVVLDLLDRVSPCSEFVDHMDSTLKITVQIRHTAVYFRVQ
jgi:hypothetical protein